MLKQSNEFSPIVTDAVVHHHELLDGTGYPHGLKGSEIPDLTQLVTIVDIFSALIEPRTYKATMSAQEAYGILLGHGREARPGAARGVCARSCGLSGLRRARHSGLRPSQQFRQRDWTGPRPSGARLLEPVEGFQRLARGHLVGIDAAKQFAHRIGLG